MKAEGLARGQAAARDHVGPSPWCGAGTPLDRRAKTPLRGVRPRPNERHDNTEPIGAEGSHRSHTTGTAPNGAPIPLLATGR